MEKKIVCIIQARTGSSRLPNKIFLDLEGKKVLGRVIERVRDSKLINKIVIASPDKQEDDVIEEYVKENYPEVGIYRGSENDVLDRYYKAAEKFKADIVIRITSDCPLMDAVVIDKVIQSFLDKDVDYASNVLVERNYPRGLDIEVFSFKALERIWQEAMDDDDREHVTLYLRKHPEIFSTYSVLNGKDYSEYRLTLDQEEDYKLISLIYKRLLPQKENFGLLDIISLLEKESELSEINKNVEQKHGKY